MAVVYFNEVSRMFLVDVLDSTIVVHETEGDGTGFVREWAWSVG
jgi:hypothetical protein